MSNNRRRLGQVCLGCGVVTNNSRCAKCRAARYGPEHRDNRRYWTPLVALGNVTCSRCHQPITPGTPWHLDHIDGTEHPAHQACNVGASD